MTVNLMSVEYVIKTMHKYYVYTHYTSDYRIHTDINLMSNLSSNHQKAINLTKNGARVPKYSANPFFVFSLCVYCTQGVFTDYCICYQSFHTRVLVFPSRFFETILTCYDWVV